MKCTKQEVLSVHFKIRHSCSLLLKNLVLIIFVEDISFAKLGRRVLKEFGCNNRHILEATGVDNTREIDVVKNLKRNSDEEEDKCMKLQ